MMPILTALISDDKLTSIVEVGADVTNVMLLFIGVSATVLFVAILLKEGCSAPAKTRSTTRVVG